MSPLCELDGIWWFVIPVSVVVGLWLLAKARGAKAASSDNTNELPKNDPLQKTAALVKELLSIKSAAKPSIYSLAVKVKVAMITIDKSLATGARRLGEVPIMNYHRVPSRDVLICLFSRRRVEQVQF